MTFKKGDKLKIDKNNIFKSFNYLNSFTIYDKVHLKELTNIHKIEDRYNDILPYKTNLVKLSNNHYINASYIHIPIPKLIIATQGPKKETINDFWQMIFENDCKVIVQLCNFNENGKEKCFNYININKLNNLDFEIEDYISKGNDNYSQINLIKIKNKITNIKKDVYHIFFFNWPDYEVPDIQKSISSFLIMFHTINQKKDNKPFIVHCSAGVGRTGCFIAIYLLYCYLKQHLNDPIIQFNIFNLVRQLREMRLQMIQTHEQFYFVYNFVKYILENVLFNK